MNDVKTSEKKAFRLGLEILAQAREGLSRFEFKRKTAGLLLRYSRSSLIDIYVQDEPYRYVWRAENKGKDFDFFVLHDEKIKTLYRTHWLETYGSGTEKSADGITVKGRRLLTIPFTIDSTQSGFVAFEDPEHGKNLVEKTKTAEQLPDELETYKFLVELIGIAILYRNTHAALKERIKELSCLYEISKIIHKYPMDLNSILYSSIKIIPHAFQYEDVALARVCLDENCYSVGQVEDSEYSLRSDIYVGGEARGHIEVLYKTKKEDFEEEPFLQEEQNLLDNIAKQFSIIIEDIKAEEDKRTLENQLRHTDRLATIGQLAAGVAHELNEPLGSILGFAELAKNETELPEKTMRDLTKIIDASKHAREIVKKLLIFGRQVESKRDIVNINEVITDGLYFFESRCEKEGIRLSIKLVEGIPDIWVDPSHMNQIMVNLVVNAIQAMPGGGNLTIETQLSEGNILIRVRDTGTGIEPDDLEKIFLPFFTTKDIGEGTGLGLAVVHGIINTYNGKINVDSRKGEGTIFTVSLPIEKNVKQEYT